MANWSDMIFILGAARLSLLYIAILMSTNWLPDLVGGSGPRMLMAINSKGLLGEHISSFC